MCFLPSCCDCCSPAKAACAAPSPWAGSRLLQPPSDPGSPPPGTWSRPCSAPARPGSPPDPPPTSGPCWPPPGPAALQASWPLRRHSSALRDGVHFLPHNTVLPTPAHRQDSLPAAHLTLPQGPRIAFLMWSHLGAVVICSQICLGGLRALEGDGNVRFLSVSPGLSPGPGCRAELIQSLRE